MSRLYGRLYGRWANARNDAAEAARLLARLRLGMQPVRPEGPKASHVPGQIPLFTGDRQSWQPAEEKEEISSS